MIIEKIQGTNMELTEAIQEYVHRRTERLARLVKRMEPATLAVEVGKPSDHHHKGDVFYAEFMMGVNGQQFRATATAESLHAAIDQVQDELHRQVKDWKDKNLTLGKRAGRAFKSLLRMKDEA